MLAEGTTVTSLVTPTAGFCGTTPTIPAALKEGEWREGVKKGGMEGGREGGREGGMERGREGEMERGREGKE